MNIEIDISSIVELLNMPPTEMAISLFFLFGWIPLALVFLWGSFLVWVNYRNGQWSATNKFIFMAIDIPKNNQQSPKAVENLFTYLAGAHTTLDLIEKYWEGRFQLSFSFEIVSIEGYTQFLIRTPEKFRNLVETAVYSQYPDAEITEVSDYTDSVPSVFPDSEWDVWGGEFMYVNPDCYPIKTYEQFEHKFGEPEFHFKDPLASLMDLNASLGDGEQLWYQIVVKPIGFDWPEKGENEVRRILNEKNSSKENIVDKLMNVLLGGLRALVDIFSPEYEESTEEKKDEALKMLELRPADKEKVEAITLKMNKLGFDAKIRVVYAAKKNVMNKPKVVNGFVGYVKQFTDLNLNNLKPDMKKTVTTATYFFKKKTILRKKNTIVSAYKSRSTTVGRSLRTMTIDELATLWHFPVDSVVKAPLIQKAAGRKVEPPMTLPTSGESRDTEETFKSDFRDMVAEDSTSDEKKASNHSQDKLHNDSENSGGDMESIFIEDQPKANFKKDILSKKEEDNTSASSARRKDDDEEIPENLPFA
ncbi:MAG: hypothetical protein PF572_00690 [Patescibacteria group bacterium]|jgi:hypothetical protein|nr:hypothetical protein [Patescibacteria group bacterium]